MIDINKPEKPCIKTINIINAIHIRFISIMIIKKVIFDSFSINYEATALS